jgi:predicted DNA-binding transcriptional regulator YafY
VLDQILQKGGYPNMQDLQRALAENDGDFVSEETIQKDIAFLKSEYDVEIKYSRSKKGYTYAKEGTSIFKKELGERETRELKAAAAKLAIFKGSPLLAPVQQTIEKLLKFLEVKSADTAGKIVVIPDDRPVARGSELLADVLDAILKQDVIQFHYYSTTLCQEMKEEVSPWLLKEYDGRWYLVGAEITKHESRLYGLDRILGNISISYKKATAPPADLDKLFDNVVGVSEFYKAPETIDVFFKKPQDWYVQTKPIHRSQIVVQESKKGTTFRYFVVRNWEFEAEVRKQRGRIVSENVL